MRAIGTTGLAAAIAAVAATAASADEIRVGMAGMAYTPAVVEAKIGDILVFENDDDTAHNVFIPTVGFATDLGKQDALASASLPLGQAGMFDVECVLHAGMHARVVVTP